MEEAEQKLKNEWGIERYAVPLGILVDWQRGKQHPVSPEQILDLQNRSEDALTLYVARVRSELVGRAG